MIDRMKRACGLIWGLFGGGLLALGSATAQEDAGEPAEIRFAAQAAPRNLGDLVMVAGEERSEPFELPVNHLSEPQTAPARVVGLVRENQPGVLTTIRLPAEGEAFIVLLVPGTETPFEPVVLPAAEDKFRPGDYYVHNISKKRVIGKVGSVTFTVPPRSGRIVKPKGAVEDRYYNVLLGVVDGGQKKPISTSRWPLSPRMRTYLFFFDNPTRGDVDFRAIDEFVPAQE
jgi:hypothetical protein